MFPISTFILLTFQKDLNIRPPPHRLHHLLQPGEITHLAHLALPQLLIMQHLKQHHIRICELLTQHKRTPLRKLILTQMPLQSLHIPRPTLLAVPLVVLLLIRREIAIHELRAPIDHKVAHAIHPKDLRLGIAIIRIPEQAAEVAEDRVRLGHGLAVELDDGEASRRVDTRGGGQEGGFDVARELVEGVADVGEGNARVEEEEADHLAAAFGEEVEVVDGRDAADAVVGRAWLADLPGCWHFGGVID